MKPFQIYPMAIKQVVLLAFIPLALLLLALDLVLAPNGEGLLHTATTAFTDQARPLPPY